MINRAAQFSPFAALTGYDDQIAETARLTDRRIELTEAEEAEISKALGRLMKGDEVEITFFVDEIIPYEAAASRLSRGVAVVVKEELAEKIGIRTLYDVVKTYRNGHDGFARGLDLEIWLDMRNGARATFRCPEFKINVVNEMRSRIEEAFGKGSFRLIPAPVKQDRQDSRRGQWRRRQN